MQVTVRGDDAGTRKPQDLLQALLPTLSSHRHLFPASPHVSTCRWRVSYIDSQTTQPIVERPFRLVTASVLLLGSVPLPVREEKRLNYAVLYIN